MSNPPKTSLLKWLLRFLSYFAGVVLFLALSGMLVFMLVGAFTNPDRDLIERALHGFRLGAELGAKVWAPAISLVFCVMKAHNEKARREASE